MASPEATRGSKKGVVTRLINKVTRNIAEGDKTAVEANTSLMKTSFCNFESIHEQIIDSLIEKNDVEKVSTEDQYFADFEEKYVLCLNQVKEFMIGDPGPASPATVSEQNAHLTKLLSLPKIEIEPFGGDDIHYYSFRAEFDRTIDAVLTNSDDKLIHLQRCTTAKAKDAIRFCSLIGGDEGYKQALDILDERFGNKHVIAERIKQSLCNGKPVKSAADLRLLSDEATSVSLVLKSVDLYTELDTQHMISSVNGRLPIHLQHRWRKSAVQQKESKGAYPKFTDFVSFICRASREASDPVYGYEQETVNCDKTTAQPQKVNSCATTVERQKCLLCNSKHALYSCIVFKRKSRIERHSFITSHKLCTICFKSDHDNSNCDSNFTCRFCKGKHSSYIHLESDNIVNGSDKTVPSPVRHVSTNATHNNYPNTYLPVVSVMVNDKLSTLALLDTASSNTFITKRAANVLKLQGKFVAYSLSTLHNHDHVINSQMVDVVLQSLNGDKSLVMSSVFIVDDIPYNNQKLDVQNYTHLKGIPLVDMSTPLQIDVLIGQDNAEALLPLCIARGQPGEPYAVESMFGWSVCGKSLNMTSHRVVSNFISGSIDSKINKLWELEDCHVGSSIKTWSVDDRKVVALWEEESKIIDGHLEVPIPWKREHLNNNIYVAKCRLKSLQISLEKKSMTLPYADAIQAMLNKGFAEPIPVDEIQSESARVWYLPHHAVPKKDGAIRIVFDCASKFKGYSLNDCAHRGPDLNNKLSNVLLRFRQHQFAAMSDISSMYNQIKVPKSDQDALRFIWSVDGQIRHYRMLVHIFGGVWSASCASFALQDCLRETEDVSIKNLIMNSFYVDDNLISVRTKDGMASAIKDLKKTLTCRGFTLTKYVSNDPSLLDLACIDEHDRTKESITKTLGIGWNSLDDSFFIDPQCLDASKSSYTKAQLLSIVASIFDPLGLVAPITITGMMIFQQANRIKINWKQQLPQDLNSMMISWVESLLNISTLHFPRCIKPQAFDVGSVELHAFCDSSERAYGCCFYLRCINQFGAIHVSLLSGKSRLAPIKSISIPRLELQAAYLAATIEMNLKHELSDLSLSCTTFWSDSRIVLAYIKNTTRRFHVFVSNRVSSILSTSEASQWRHISGKENPADLLTRGMTVQNLPDIWYTGPNFLMKHKSEWESTDTSPYDVPLGDPELKKTITTFETITEYPHPVSKLLLHYSDWGRAMRATAWLIKFRLRIIKKNICHYITASDVTSAERSILFYIQNLSYHKDMTQLAKGGNLRKDSDIRHLMPRLNDQGLLIVSGRLKHSTLPLRHREPYIIPHQSPAAMLIARYYHNAAHHGVEWTLCDIRERYWITKARIIVKRVKHECIPCKRLFGKPASQLMADLPPDRIDIGKPAFSITGVDCFGPYNVMYRRSTIVRYGCIFTCFNTRAIHIEMLNSLEADSFVNGLRRFIARRGTPTTLYSDNATNFTSASKQLTVAHDEMVQVYCAKKMIEWKFIPPRASHFGGAWERLIGTIRKVSDGILEKHDRMTDEILSTFFCEIESIVNGRPLTKISEDVMDPSPLTPNHLLLLRGNPNLSLGASKCNDIYRSRWRHVQSLGDQFWKQWTRQYLPQLQRRTKWLVKQRNMKVGDLVLMLDENTPRSLWPLALVIAVNEGRDGLVRSLRLKTKSSELVRPVTKVVFLEAFGDDVVTPKT